MGKKSRTRQSKFCQSCLSENQYELFRVRSCNTEEWIFVCDVCKNNLKKLFNTYEYGGTWKRNKRN